MIQRPQDEYSAVRNAAGVWLRDDAALILISGADRFTWLQGMISNDTTLLASGFTARLSACILDATGHLLSEVTLTAPHNQPDSLWMEVPAAERSSLLDRLDRFLITEDVEMGPLDMEVVTLQGPESGAIAADVCGHLGVAYYAADHTGSEGFDWYVPAASSLQFVQDAETKGATEIEPEVRDLLRIEAGIPKYGADMDATVIALEAGLGPTHISLMKGCYVGQEIIARIDSRGHTNRALTGFVFPYGAVPSPGDRILPAPTDTEPVPREAGRITSVAPASPAMGGRPIALGYLRHEYRSSGTSVSVGENGLVAEVVELPFWRGVSYTAETSS